jgi:metal transporter CNNM
MAAGSAASPANALVSMRHLRVNTLVLLLVNTFAPLVRAFPLVQRTVSIFVDEDLPKSPKDASLWVYLSTAIALVLLGGAFAGLTIA